MSETKSSYGSIMKATSIFGGVQVFNILITLIRGKFVAILIGTAGMGLNGLLLSGLNLIRTITSLGVSESAVRDIAKHEELTINYNGIDIKHKLDHYNLVIFKKERKIMNVNELQEKYKS